jgi:hypothetical protein
MRPEIIVSGLAITGVAFAAPGKIEARTVASEPVQFIERASMPAAGPKMEAFAEGDFVAKAGIQQETELQDVPCRIL